VVPTKLMVEHGDTIVKRLNMLRYGRPFGDYKGGVGGKGKIILHDGRYRKYLRKTNEALEGVQRIGRTAYNNFQG